MVPRLNPNVRLSAYTHPYCIITVSYYNAEKSEVATCRAYLETFFMISAEHGCLTQLIRAPVEALLGH